MLYRYPHADFPYIELKAHTAKRSAHDAEYEVTDTGVFDESRYCDLLLKTPKTIPRQS